MSTEKKTINIQTQSDKLTREKQPGLPEKNDKSHIEESYTQLKTKDPIHGEKTQESFSHKTS